MKYNRVTLIDALITQELSDEVCPGHYGLAENCKECRQCWREALDKVLKPNE